MPYEKIENIHDEINQRAFQIANEDAEKDIYGTLSTEFRKPGLENPFRMREGSQKIGIELRDTHTPFYLPEDIEALHAIGREAIRKAIVEKGSKFVGLILGTARKGRNYFDETYES